MTRVRVAAPTRQSRVISSGRPAPHGGRRASGEDDAAQVYLRSLLRSQLRLALVIALGFLLIAGLFSLVGWVPWLRGLSILGVPFAWILLGAGLFPVILLSAVLYTRQAQRNEERYRDLTEER